MTLLAACLAPGASAVFRLLLCWRTTRNRYFDDDESWDLPSIEELETALAKYSGAILAVSHDNKAPRKLGGKAMQIGEQ